MAWISSNKALTVYQMNNNAREFWNFFQVQGFTLESVCGMLGNAARESTVNPGVWQNHKVNYNMGFGLLQWTPATKLISWMEQNGYDRGSGEGQCRRIMWEYRNGQQYYKTKSYPISFTQYSHSTESVSYLVQAFFANYERGNKDKAAMSERISWGNYFYNLLGGSSPDPPTPPEPEPQPEPSDKPMADRIRRVKIILFNTKKRRE